MTEDLTWEEIDGVFTHEQADDMNEWCRARGIDPEILTSFMESRVFVTLAEMAKAGNPNLINTFTAALSTAFCYGYALGEKRTISDLDSIDP